MHGIINPFCIVLYAQRMNRMGGLLQSQKGLSSVARGYYYSET